jgi:hypothetical protein
MSLARILDSPVIDNFLERGKMIRAVSGGRKKTNQTCRDIQSPALVQSTTRRTPTKSFLPALTDVRVTLKNRHTILPLIEFESVGFDCHAAELVSSSSTARSAGRVSLLPNET